jgi:general stress protein 26
MAAIVGPGLSVWLVTYRSSAKVAQLGVNPRLALAFVEPPAGDTAATVYGRASFVDDDAEKSRVWRLSPYDLTHHFPEGPGSAEFCLLKVDVESIEWWDRWEDGRRVYRPPGAPPLPDGEPNGAPGP